MKTRQLLTALAATAGLAIASPSTADVNIVGSDVDLGSGWRSGSSTFDINGDGYLGTDGYMIIQGGKIELQPSYGTFTTSVFYGGNANYADLDNPTTTPGGAPTLLTSPGTLNPLPGLGNEANLVTLTLSRDLSPGETIRIGLGNDGSDNAAFNADGFRVTDSQGGNQFIDVSSPANLNNRNTDFHYFDVTGLSSGDTVNIIGEGGSNNYAILEVVSFDSINQVANGTQIGIDLGPTVTNNWNNIVSNNAGVAAGSVVDLNGIVLDGVAIATSNSQFTNNDGTDNWVGLASNAGSAPAEFVDSVTTDISGNFNTGDANPYTVTVTGLDPNLEYDITVVTTAFGSRIDTINILGDVTYGPSPISRPDAAANGTFHSFSGVMTDGSGQLVITSTDTAASTNPIMNGILINVVPEPSSLALLGLGGFIALRRRR